MWGRGLSRIQLAFWRLLRDSEHPLSPHHAWKVHRINELERRLG
jgi:hypothetical protein